MATHLELDSVPEALQRAAATERGVTLIDRDLNAEELSYEALAEDAARCAAHLSSLGVSPGDRVPLLAPTSADLLRALFGAWWAGAVPIVLPLPRKQSELDTYVDDMMGRVKATEARVLVLSEAFLPFVPDIDVLPARAVTTEELAGGRPTPAEPVRPDPDDLAYLQFTSGTTARSRAVALSHRNLVENMGAVGAMLGIGPDDVLVSWLPLFHDMGLISMVLGGVFFRIPLVLEPTEEFLRRPGSWLDAISHYGGTAAAAPNFGYGLAARDLRSRPRDLDLSSWRVAGNGAEPIDVSALDRFTEVATEHGFRPESMCPMFGLAEGTLAVTLSTPEEPLHVEHVSREVLETQGRAEPAPPDEHDARPLVSCGRPIPGHDVSIRGRDGDPLPEGHIGEIWFRGPSVMQGYWRDPETTAETICDGWLRTGDLGYLGPHGLVVTGRIKDVVILGGRNLYPEDYEACTEDVDGVRRGNVIAFALPERERMVVVAETTAEPEETDGVARSVLELLRRRLPRGPEEVVLVAPGTIPKTSSGKRQRGRCRDRYASGELQPLAVARRG